MGPGAPPASWTHETCATAPCSLPRLNASYTVANDGKRVRITSQGDLSSPHNRVSFFDIALSVLHIDRHDGSPRLAKPSRPQVHCPPHVVGDIGYADDLVSTARSMSGLQLQAGIVSTPTCVLAWISLWPSCASWSSAGTFPMKTASSTLPSGPPAGCCQTYRYHKNARYDV